LVTLLRPAGFQRQRTQQLKALLAAVEAANRERGVGPFARRPRDLTLDLLRTLDDAEAEAFLTALPGIGPKSARCVLAYSLEHRGREGVTVVRATVTRRARRVTAAPVRNGRLRSRTRRATQPARSKSSNAAATPSPNPTGSGLQCSGPSGRPQMRSTLQRRR
jgi:endonuclease III